MLLFYDSVKAACEGSEHWAAGLMVPGVSDLSVPCTFKRGISGLCSPAHLYSPPKGRCSSPALAFSAGAGTARQIRGGIDSPSCRLFVRCHPPNAHGSGWGALPLLCSFSPHPSLSSIPPSCSTARPGLEPFVLRTMLRLGCSFLQNEPLLSSAVI